jgi:hypothetical protein
MFRPNYYTVEKEFVYKLGTKVRIVLKEYKDPTMPTRILVYIADGVNGRTGRLQ